MAMQGFDMGYNVEPAINLNKEQIEQLRKALEEKDYFNVL